MGCNITPRRSTYQAAAATLKLNRMYSSLQIHLVGKISVLAQYLDYTAIHESSPKEHIAKSGM